MATTTISLRKARLEDSSRLAEIAYFAWERDLMPLLPHRPGVRENERRRFEMVVRETNDRILVAEAADKVVGWCSRARGRAYIPFLMVVPDFQGHGIGSLLLKRMEIMLELEGNDRVQLDTLADNVRAVNFYQRQGYRILVIRPGGQGGSDDFTNVRLEKRLAPYTGPIPDID